ncbi:hypothetical protein BBW79_12375 [Listeria monocytogenes]|nr:hypothetical protein [Listeria monocytogenes]
MFASDSQKEQGTEGSVPADGAENGSANEKQIAFGRFWTVVWVITLEGVLEFGGGVFTNSLGRSAYPWYHHN